MDRFSTRLAASLIEDRRNAAARSTKHRAAARATDGASLRGVVARLIAAVVPGAVPGQRARVIG
jgi:hypothetical protein